MTPPTNITAIGKDKFGPFVLDTRILPCDACGASNSARIAYTKQPSIPLSIRQEDTILPQPLTMWLGVTCGCYAKFHRQVAHIETTQKLGNKRLH